MTLSALEDILPLSPLQEGLLFHGVFDETATDVYLSQVGVGVRGQLDPDRLRRAARALVDRHAALRAGFRYEQLSRPVQIIPRQVQLPWAEVDLRGAADVDAAVRAVAQEDLGRRFDLAAPPLVRFTLARLGDAEFRFLVTFHHLLVDGWSIPVLLQELFELYAADGCPDRLPPVVPYRSFLGWLAGRDRSAAVEAWQRALAGLPGPTLVASPGAGRRPTAPERIEFELSRAQSDAVRALARSRSVTLGTLLQAAWGLVLSSLTGQQDVVFGITVSGRPPELQDIDSAVGFFINTVPMRVRLDPAETPAALLRRLQEEQSELLDHQHLGLAEVQRVAGHGELFDTLTVLRNYPHTAGQSLEPGGEQSGAQGPLVTDVSGLDAVHYPLGMVAVPGDRLRCRLDYRPDVFDAPYAGRVVELLRRVLVTLVAQPDLPLGRFALLPDAERDTALAVATGRPAPAPAASLTQAFAARVRRAPDADAVVAPGPGGGTRLSYARLDLRSDQVAARLQAAGVGPGATVALAMDRSADLVVATLGVVKAGAAYVPLHPGHPPQRLRQVVAEVDAALVLADAAGAQRAGDLGRRTLLLEEFGPDEDGPGPAPVPGPVHPGTPAYVMYTSGSTGTPKGVVVPHRAVLARALDDTWLPEALPRVLVQAPHAFDASTNEIWPALLRGGCLVVAPAGDLTGPVLRGLVAEHGLTGVCLPTALFHVLAEEDPQCLAGVRQVWIGGEAASAAAVGAFLEASPDTTVTNVYGPTEATTYVAACHLRDPDEVAGGVVPLGGPVSATAVHVLDTALRPVADGVLGELYVAGDGLALGYLARPGATCERFVADPHGPAGTRMYRTGDRARRRADGTLQYAGRVDDQVKVRGFRVEPAEVEAALAAQPGVARAVVVAGPDAGGGQALVAYVTGAPGTVPDADALRAAVAGQLPDYMVPAAVVPLEALPLSPNGKIDRGRLPDPAGPARREGAGRAPRTPQEQVLCSLFADVLGVPEVGVDDDFFDLGGHSLLATRLVSRIRSVLAVELAMGDLFDTPTVAGLSAPLSGAARGRAALTRRERPDRLPLSFAQRRLWFLQELEGPGATYITSVALRLSGPLEAAVLEQALADVVARHESLRTVFQEDGDAPYQLVLPPERARPALPVVAVAPHEVPAEVDEVTRAGFDLTRDLPLRARLMRLAPDEHVLAVAMHHIAGDAWSRAPLTRDLAEAYAARRSGHAPAWEALPVQYADYTLWQQEVLGADDDPGSPMGQALAFWRKELAALPDELALPVDRPRPALPSHRGDMVDFVVPAEVQQGLAALARQQHATVFMVLQAAVGALLTRLGAGEDIPFGTPLAGRTDDALDDLVGFFVNTLVLRTDTSADPTFTELVDRVRRADLAAYAHQEMPFERLVELLNPVRSLATHPLFQVLLTYDTTGRPGDAARLDLPGLRVDPVAAETGAAKFDLAFGFFEREAPGTRRIDLAGVVEFSTDLFDRSTVERLVRWLQRVLRLVVADPAHRIGELDLLDLSERHEVLERWNRADLGVVPATFPDLFAARVAAAPRRQAVSCGDRRLSYQELAERAGRLARHLTGLGVGPECRVAVALPASPEWVVALVAVLEAGGVYLPVDPDYPAERVAFMLADAAPGLLVTTSELAGRLPTGPAPLLLDDPRVQAVLDGAAVVPADGGTPVVSPAVPGPARPDNAAYVIYTSGSTGRPKGVEVTHRGLAALVTEQEHGWGVAPGSRVLQLVSSSFDASLWDVFSALGTGSTLVLPPGDRPLGARLAQLVADEAVTHLAAPPAVVADVAAHGLPASVTVTLTGEACPPRLARRLAAERPVINGYGPTESTIGTAFWRCRTDDTGPRTPIGRPIRNTRVYVLDERLRLVPPGALGELYIAGSGLARGYVARAAGTAERFVADPFGPPGTRMYRTGDVGRWSAPGVLDFLRRSDDQVKIRGLRIELSEIESVLADHPDVERCVVVARVAAEADARLVAYVVPAADALPAAGELRQHLAERLPRYMIPAGVVVLPALPLTPNGKVDRDALPEPTAADAGGDPGTAARRAPRTPREDVLCGLFAEALGLPDVGPDDDFFHLGGHSLLVTRLVGRIRTVLGVQVSIRNLFETPTAAGLAAALDAGGPADPFEVLLPLRLGGDRPPLHCVHPGLGLSWCYTGLARHLPAEVPVYGLQARGLTGPGPLPASVDELVADYCEQLRRVQPHGPYRLLGWSTGALLAHRMATLLQERGERVDVLALVDALPRTAAADTARDQEALLAALSADVGADPRTLDGDGERDVLTRLRRREHPLGQLPPGRLAAATDALLNLTRLGNQVTLGHYDGDVLLFTSEVDGAGAEEAARSWAPHVGGRIDQRTLPAPHGDLMTDAASLVVVAATLAATVQG